MTYQEIKNNLITDGYSYVKGTHIPAGGMLNPYNHISDSGDTRQGIIVPLYEYPTYFNPSGDYQSVQAGAPFASCLILNGSSGPPNPMNNDWTNQLLQLHAAGVMGIGYVPTNFGGTPIATVKNMIDVWYADMASQQGAHNNLIAPIDGIFFDEGDFQASTQPYYLELYNYVKSKDNGSGANFVVLNPGDIPDESYMQASDVLCVVENTYTFYTTQFQALIPNWFPFYPARKFMHVVTSVTDTTKLATVQALSKTLRGGYLYCIDSAGNYTTLAGNATATPAIWTNQISWCQKMGLS